MRRRIRLSRWFRFLLFCLSLAKSFFFGRGATPWLFLSVNLHEIGRVGCNLCVGYVLVLAFEEDPSHEVLAISLALDSPVTPSTIMKRAYNTSVM